MSFRGVNSLKSFIKVHKDKIETGSRNNVVYKISCKDCNATYVGQTKRLLKNRIKEHYRHITRNTDQNSVITDHRLSGHEFDWDNIDILDEETNLHERLISEMI